MNNRNKQTNIEDIRSLIAQLELSKKRVEREIHELNRRLSTKEANMTIIAEARIVHQGEGLHGTNLHIGNQITIVKPKPDQQNSGVIKETKPTGLIFVRTSNGKIIRRSVNNISAIETIQGNSHDEQK